MYRMLICFVIIVMCGCSAQYHAKNVQAGLDGNRLTTGVVQSEIKKGMTSAQVAEVLGSPNIVSTDENGNEVWIYDKHATDVVAEGSRWFVSAASASKSQRTLTIIINFDGSGKLSDVAYHSSRF